MTILIVGAGQDYSTIHDAVAASHDGDVLRVQAGTYFNDFATIRDSISLEAVGGVVHVAATESPPDGKAIFTLGTDSTNISITGFEFSGAAVADNNGAGIRYEGGSLTLIDDYFHDNQDGLLGSPGTAGTGTITIKNSEFSHNGAGDGYSHNLYVGDVAALNIDGSYFHDAVVGHEIKSRAESTTITNSRIVDGSGTASYSIDLPNGGNATISGNVIEQGANSQNPNIIAYGEEGSLRASNSLTVTGNTIVNDLASGSARAVWNASNETATISNNSLFGLTVDQVASGPAAVTGLTFLNAEPTLDASSPWTSGITGAGTAGSTGGTSTGSPTTGTATGGSTPTDSGAGGGTAEGAGSGGGGLPTDGSSGTGSGATPATGTGETGGGTTPGGSAENGSPPQTGTNPSDTGHGSSHHFSASEAIKSVLAWYAGHGAEIVAAFHGPNRAAISADLAAIHIPQHFGAVFSLANFHAGNGVPTIGEQSQTAIL